MVDDEFEATVSQELRAAGLQPLSLDDPETGGFGVQPDDEMVFVTWTPSEALCAAAFEKLAAGDTGDSSVIQMGQIKHTMADAMLKILGSAGLDATMSSDGMAPATVEVRPVG